jgi:hypothetical protein
VANVFDGMNEDLDFHLKNKRPTPFIL